jgi:flagellar capping protein FliD
LLAGQVVSGAGIPSGTKIQSIGTGEITLDNALTSSISGSSVYLPIANQGVSVRLGGLLSLSLSSTTSEPGLFKTASSAISSQTSSIQKQIDAMERRILARQKQLEASFVAMERAQSRSQSQLSQLSNAFTNTK